MKNKIEFKYIIQNSDEEYYNSDLFQMNITFKVTDNHTETFIIKLYEYEIKLISDKLKSLEGKDQFKQRLFWFDLPEEKIEIVVERTDIVFHPIIYFNFIKKINNTIKISTYSDICNYRELESMNDNIQQVLKHKERYGNN